MFDFEPAKGNFRNRSIHSGEMRAQIPLLKIQRRSNHFLEELFVTVEQSLMDGRFGIDLFQSGMVIMAAGYITERRHVGKASEIAGNRSQPLRNVLLNDELILGEAFEGFHTRS